MHLDDLPVVLAVQERDIDLLILEELHATPAFAAWWAALLGLSGATFDGAWHSVSNADGETDVLLRVHVGQERIGVLIENKIAACEQHEQDVRYHRRGAQGLKDAWFDRYLTCIVAPQTYLAGLADDSRYDARVPYESIAAWFAEQPGARATWRCRVMHEAVTQGRRSYVKVVSEAVTAFHRDYHAYLCRTQPTLRMVPPTEKGARGHWVIVQAQGWPPGLWLNHHMSSKGGDHVDLGLKGFTQSDISSRVGELPSDIIPLTSGKQAGLSIRVPTIDFKGSVAAQIDALDEVFAAMLRLVPYARYFV
ncbi:hypothetical protein [Rhodanobacter aciditrophus]|uniref:hypothetical protein n=1 Tax=Rhodanobacter aciditrophus TaxID=1623218 RepID=UPI003CEB8095